MIYTNVYRCAILRLSILLTISQVIVKLFAHWVLLVSMLQQATHLQLASCNVLQVHTVEIQIVYAWPHVAHLTTPSQSARDVIYTRQTARVDTMAQFRRCCALYLKIAK